MDLLEKLTQVPGVSGREHRVRTLIEREIEGLFDDVRTDAMGSLVCIRHARTPAKRAAAPLRIMVAAHMDQIGFLVKHVDDKGFLRVRAVGGFDMRNLFSRLCTICPDVEDPSKDLVGVMNPEGRPIHLATEEEKKKVPEMGEFYIDLCRPADQVKRHVKIGDMVVLQSPFVKTAKAVIAQAFDNRVACWVAIRAVQKLAARDVKHACEIAVVFTVQEEVGLRGAQTSAFGVRPDIGIGVDCGLAVDTPGVPEDQRVMVQGGGVTLDVMDGDMIADVDLVETFEAIAKKQRIKHQRCVAPRGGTDGAAIQRSRCGTRSMTLICPARYIHTVAETVLLSDLHATRDLLAAYLAEAK